MTTTTRTALAVSAATLLLATACTGTGAGEGTGADATGVAAAGTAGPGGAAMDGVTVTGAGEATGEPDVLSATVGVEVERDDVQQALDDANAATEQVLAALDDAGVAEQDRQTRDFAVRPAFGPEGQEGGYTVVNLVEATVRDVDRVGEVLEAAVAAGGDDARVQGVRFDLEDDRDQLAAAREAAVADARASAEQYAELAGVELGELLAIDDRSVSSPRRAGGEEMAMDDAAASPVPIEPGERAVVVQVTARWSLG